MSASIEAESTLGLGSGLGYMFRVRVQNHEGLIEIRLYGYIRARDY